MLFEDLIDKYIDNNKAITVQKIKEDTDDVLFFLSFLDDGVVFNQMAFIKGCYLNEESYYTEYKYATDYLRRQPILTALFETIAFKIMERSTSEERKEILSKYDDLEGDLFIDESSFYIARYVYGQIIKTQ